MTRQTDEHVIVLLECDLELKYNQQTTIQLDNMQTVFSASAVLENTALVQGIRCEPIGEHLIPWTCALFFHTARN